MATATPETLSYMAVEPDVVPNSIMKVVKSAAAAALDKHDSFFIGVSGGSLVKYFVEGFKSLSGADRAALQLPSWRIFYVDERLVPLTDADSNHYAWKSLYDMEEFEVPSSHIFPPNTALEPAEAASEYEKRIAEEFKSSRASETPQFDLLLLGMGPDGHTCSLFPGNANPRGAPAQSHMISGKPQLHTTDKLVTHLTDSPKPPPSRITFTYPLIRKSSGVYIVATGEGKAEALKTIATAVREGKGSSSLPCARIADIARFLVDSKLAAASGLQQTSPQGFVSVACECGGSASNGVTAVCCSLDTKPVQHNSFGAPLNGLYVVAETGRHALRNLRLSEAPCGVLLPQTPFFSWVVGYSRTRITVSCPETGAGSLQVPVPSV